MKPTKTLQTLIRLNQWELDEQRRQLVTLQERETALDKAEQILLQEGANEKQLMADEAMAGVDFSHYRRSLKSRGQLIDQQQQEVEGQIVTQKDEVIDQFREVKTYEIADEARRARWEKWRNDKEAQEMDDRAVMRPGAGASQNPLG
jgi:flagellar protein FliJ